MSPPGRVAEEIRKGDRLAGFDSGLKDEIAYREIENAESERRENARPLVVKPESFFQYIDERARNEFAIAGLRFRKMKRRTRLQTMVNVVDNILSLQNDV